MSVPKRLIVWAWQQDCIDFQEEQKGVKTFITGSYNRAALKKSFFSKGNIDIKKGEKPLILQELHKGKRIID